MRVAAGSLACLGALTSLALAAPQNTTSLPTYHLRGYYELHYQTGVWQSSNNSPWQVVKDEPWIQDSVVKWGYVPMTHDSKHYYCLIDDHPRTGSNILGKTFVCGDPATVETLSTNNLRPKLPLYGGGN